MQHLGLVDYQQAWDYQQELMDTCIARKLANRTAINPEIQKHYLILCEHPAVFTLGKSGSMDNLLVKEDELEHRGVNFYKINRGGDITHHGPGQLVGYPILDLDEFFTDIHKYLRFLEEAIILTLKNLGLTAGRLQGATGVWLEPEVPARARKICAMGIRASRWVTMHGFALNVNNDLDYFDWIIPCGIDDKQVTSIKKELGRTVEMERVMTLFQTHFSKLFGATLTVDLSPISLSTFD
ncbi:lipoyl(octanoyl) transferase LipB [soil metagenome]